jgi:hypothetical protein
VPLPPLAAVSWDRQTPPQYHLDTPMMSFCQGKINNPAFSEQARKCWLFFFFTERESYLQGDE